LEGPDYLPGQQGRKQRKRSSSPRHATVQRNCPRSSAGNWHAAVHPSQHATSASVKWDCPWGKTGARHAAVNAPQYATKSSLKWDYPWSKTSAGHATVNAPQHATKSSVKWDYPWSKTSAGHATVDASQHATVDASKYAAVQRNYSGRKTNSRHAADAAVQWNYAGSKTRPQHATFDTPQYATDERFRHETSGASNRETGATSETRDSAATLVRSRNFGAVLPYLWLKQKIIQRGYEIAILELGPALRRGRPDFMHEGFYAIAERGSGRCVCRRGHLGRRAGCGIRS